MADWISGMIARWILDEIKNGGVDSLARKVNALVIPWLHGQKSAVFRKLKAEAAKTQTPLDDVALDAVESFLSYLLPDPGNF